MIDSLKLITKQIILNVKQIINSWINIVYFLFIVFITMSICMIFIPFRYGAGPSYSINTILVSSIIFGGVGFQYRHSTLYINQTLSKSNNWIFHSSTIITIILFSVISSTILTIMFSILNSIHMLLIDWWKYYENSIGGDSSTTYIMKFNFDFYSEVIYVTILNSIVVFSISFAVQHIVKSMKVYYFIILSLIIVTIIFGGALNPYFYAYYDTSYNPVKWGLRPLRNPIYPWGLFWPTTILPFFSTGTLLNRSTDLTVVLKNTGDHAHMLITSYVCVARDFYATHSNITAFFFTKNNNLKWEILMIIPYLELIVLLLIGLLSSKISKK